MTAQQKEVTEKFDDCWSEYTELAKKQYLSILLSWNAIDNRDIDKTNIEFSIIKSLKVPNLR